MGKFFRQISFAILVLLLTVVIFLMVSRNNAIKQSVIENSLGLLGERLFAMVPDGEQKQSAREQYQRFMERVTNQELEPAQVEYVAASILNASTQDTLLTPEAATAIFTVKLDKPTATAAPAETGKKFVPRPPQGVPPPVPPEDWENLGQRIRRMCEFNENLQREFAKHADWQQQLPRQIWFSADDGLHLAIDPRLQLRLEHKEFQQLRREMEQLELEKIIIWRENFAGKRDSLRMSMEKLKELEKLQHLEHLSRLPDLENLPVPEALKALGALKALEILKAQEVLDTLKGPPHPDSIRQIIQKLLEEDRIRQKK